MRKMLKLNSCSPLLKIINTVNQNLESEKKRSSRKKKENRIRKIFISVTHCLIYIHIITFAVYKPLATKSFTEYLCYGG